MHPRLQFALIFLCQCHFALAQQNICTTPVASEDCESSCITCGFSGAGGSTAHFAGGTGLSFCAAMNNTQWFAFVAGSSTATFTLTPSACTLGQGLEMAIYEDCNSAPIACNAGNGNAQPLQLQNVPLVIGQVYRLLIDGTNGDICNFTVSASPPIPPPQSVGTPGPIVGPANVCPGITATYSIAPASGVQSYRWTIPPGATLNGMAGPGPIILDALQGTNVQIKFGDTGGNISVYGSNLCNVNGGTKTRAVSVGPIPPTNLPPVSICNNQLPYTLPWGEAVTKTGVYTRSYLTPLGCDSTVVVRLNVISPVTKPIGNFVVCEGESISICGQTFETPGSHTVICPNATGAGCDTAVIFSIARPSAVILGGGSLNCFNGAVPVWSGNQSGKKTWKNNSGQVVSTNDSLVVTQAGRYSLEVTEIIAGKGCISRQSIEIKAIDTLKLSVLPNIPPITCAKPLTTVRFATNMLASMPQSTTGATTFTHNVSVGTPSSLIFLANTSGGCEAEVLVNVPSDLVAPAVTARGDTISCQKTSATISAVSPFPSISYFWTGISGVIGSNQPQLQVTVPGTYTVVAVNTSNGCSNSATATVVDFNAPSISAKGGTIFCPQTNLKLGLTLTGNTTNVGVLWQGPNNFTSNLLEPTVSVPGVYTVSVINTISMCANTAAVTVIRNVSGFAVPPVVGGNLTCANPTVQLQVPGLPSNFTYQWTGPNGFSSSLAAPMVSVAGTYLVSVTDAANGCRGTATAMVGSNINLPTAQAVGGTLPCKPPSLTLNCLTNATNPTFQWSGPNGFSATLRNPIVNQQGSYRVTVTNSDGCTKTATVTVQPHIAAPYVFLSLVTTAGQRRLNCNTFAINPTYAWVGPNNFTANIANPVVTDAGIYTVLVSDGSTLGCQTYKSIIVPALRSNDHYDGAERSQDAALISGTWHLFPNPATHVVWLRFEGEKRPTETLVRLLDATGRLVLAQRVNPADDGQIDLEGIIPGVYQMLFSSDQATEAKLLVVRKL